jgi:MFS family permease
MFHWASLTRRDQVKCILVGFLAMLLSMIALAVILVTILANSKREIAIEPLYLLIPIVAFAAGWYWSLRHSSRPKVPAKPSSNVTVIAKSVGVGVAGMIVAVIAYVTWIWFRFPKNVQGFGFIVVNRLFYWPVLLGVFLGGFILEYRRSSRRQSTLTGDMSQ